MAYVSDKLYNGYLRRNMPTIVSRVKPNEIMIHLPCLTAHDRDVIQAKTETRGKYDGMVCLLDCLRRREQWPEQLIEALQACEHRIIAAEIRAEYNSLKGLDNSSSGSPPTTVVTAHVHPAPSVRPLQPPEGAAVSRPDQAAEAPAAESPEAEAPVVEATEADAPAAEAPVVEATEADAPHTEAAQAEPPEVEAPEAVQVHPSVSPPEPALQPPQAAQIEVPPPPSTPPPSPEAPRQQTTPDPQTVASAHQQPEENSESDSDQDVTAPETHHPEDEERQQRRPSPPPSDFSVTSEKLPVQDTTPPLVKVLTEVQQPEHTSEPSTQQVVGTGPDEPGLHLIQQDDSVCLSKPAQLISIPPPNQSCPTLLAPSYSVPPPAQSCLTQEPYSGNSDRLEISQPAPDVVPAGSALVCQENGVAHSPSKPEENHYDSPTSSFIAQDVLVYVGHVSEEPSILNLHGQTPTAHSQINGEVAKDAALSPQLPSPASAQSHLSSESSGAAAEPEALPPSPAPQTRITKYTAEEAEPPPPPPPPGPEHNAAPQSPIAMYVLTAVGVGACALLVAWRFRN